MTRLPASVIKHAHLADEPFVLQQDEAPPRAMAPVVERAAVASTAPSIPVAPIAPIAPLSLVDPAHVRQEGYQEGLEAGLRQGLAKAASEQESSQRELQRQIKEAQEAQKALDAQTAEAESRARALDHKLQMLDGTLKELNQLKEDLARTAEDDLVAICFGLATQVFEQAVVSPDFLSSLVRRAAGELNRGASLTVHVHPQDLDWLKQSGTPADGSEAQALEWVADPAVELGGCVLHSEQAALDARLEQQLEVFRQRLLHLRQQRRPPGGAHSGASA